MVTLNNLSDQVIRLLSAGTKTKDSKLDREYIQREIRQVTHKLLKAEYFSDKNAGENSINHLCIATYTDVEVQLDEQRNRCYAELPAYPMRLPGNIGVYEVKPYTGDIHEDVAMIPIQPGELELFRSLNEGIEVLRDQWTFEPDRDRVWFSERNNNTLLEEEIESVEMRLIVIDPEQIDGNDNYPVGPDMELDILKEVLTLHGYTAREAADMINDGNPNNK